MTKPRFADNPDYVRYERLLVLLHDLIAQGAGDSGRAEEVRDEMDEPESRLSRPEQVRLDGLSADLYMLQDREIFEEATPAERSLEGMGVELDRAWRAGDWERVLALLRKGPSFLTRAQFADVRARCYANLGHRDVAALFLRLASRIEPRNPWPVVMLIDLLEHAGRVDEAAAEAERIIADDSANPLVRLQSAETLLRRALTPDVPIEHSLPLRERLAEVMRRAFERLREVPQPGPVGLVLPDYYISWALCLASLGRTADALHALDEALAIEPTSAWALRLRDLLRQPSPASAEINNAFEPAGNNGPFSRTSDLASLPPWDPAPAGAVP